MDFKRVLNKGLLGCCCPCVLTWINAERIGENPLLYCLGGFIWPMGIPLRTKTREKYGISVSKIQVTS